MMTKVVCATTIANVNDEAKVTIQARAGTSDQTGTVEMVTDTLEAGDAVAHQETPTVQAVMPGMIMTGAVVMTVTSVAATTVIGAMIVTTVTIVTGETTATVIVTVVVTATMTATEIVVVDVVKIAATLQARSDLGHPKLLKTNATVVQFSSSSSPLVFAPKTSSLSLRRLVPLRRHRLSRTELVDVQRGKLCCFRV